MIFLEIPFVHENKSVNKSSAEKEIQILNISQELKAEVFDAIYNQRPSGVNFENSDLEQVLLLEKALGRLGIPYRQVKDE
jgi:hypothetical protein